MVISNLTPAEASSGPLGWLDEYVYNLNLKWQRYVKSNLSKQTVLRLGVSQPTRVVSSAEEESAISLPFCLVVEGLEPTYYWPELSRLGPTVTAKSVARGNLNPRLAEAEDGV